MNGAPHRLVPGPARRAVLRGRRGAPPPRASRSAWSRVFEGWDYEEIIPPLFDYADVFAGPALAPRRRTRSWAATAACSRCAPTSRACWPRSRPAGCADRPAPIRLYYSGEVLRYEPPKAGRQSELYQMGLEHLGGDAARGRRRGAGDRRRVPGAAGRRAAGCSRSATSASSHGLRGGAPGSTRRALETLRERVEAKDAAGVREVLAGAAASGRGARRARAPHRAGRGRAVLDEAARAFAFCPPRAAAVGGAARGGRTRCAAAGLGERVAIDLGEVRGLDYYTGLVFRVYAPGLGFEVGGGGRYDTLLARFGRPHAGRRLHARPRPPGAAARAPGRGCAVAEPRRREAGRRRRSLGAALARARAPARDGRARALRERRARDEPHRRALEGQAARRARRRCSARAGLPFPDERGPPAGGGAWTACASCS